MYIQNKTNIVFNLKICITLRPSPSQGCYNLLRSLSALVTPLTQRAACHCVLKRSRLL